MLDIFLIVLVLSVASLVVWHFGPRLWIAGTAVVLSVGALASENCGYPNPYATAFVSPKSQLGEFRLSLSLPNLDDGAASRNHFVFATIWGPLLDQQLEAETSGLCRTVMTPDLYPDLLVNLIGNFHENDEKERRYCIQTLEKVARTYRPPFDRVKSVVEREAQLRLRIEAQPPNPVMEADDILQRATRQIYLQGSLMQALASVDGATFQAVDADTFLAWLNHQQRSERLRLTEIPRCSDSAELHTKDASGDSQKVEELPRSELAPPGIVDVLLPKAATARSLRNLLIVGLAPPNHAAMGTPTRDTSHATAKYCNHEAEAGVSGQVTIRCLRVMRNRSAWVVFFCDPMSCVGQEQAISAMKAIGNDPLVLQLAAEAADHGQLKGPYFVSVRIASE